MHAQCSFICTQAFSAWESTERNISWASSSNNCDNDEDTTSSIGSHSSRDGCSDDAEISNSRGNTNCVCVRVCLHSCLIYFWITCSNSRGTHAFSRSLTQQTLYFAQTTSHMVWRWLLLPPSHKIKTKSVQKNNKIGKKEYLFFSEE